MPAAREPATESTRSRGRRPGVPSLHDLNRLRILRAVATHGSMNAAAVTLNYTRAAVSQHIAQLEREIGAAVVVRHARGARLTAAGEILVRHAEDLLARVAEAEDEVADIVGARRGRLRLGTFGSAIPSLIADTLTTFGARHPAVDVTLTTDEPGSLLRRLHRREIDCAVVFDVQSDPLPGGGLRIRHLLDDPMALAVPVSHRPDLGRKTRLSTLNGARWIAGPDPYCLEVLRKVCRTAGFEPAVPFRTSGYAEALAMVAAGHGIALVPGMVSAEVGPGVALCETDPPAPVRRISAVMLDAGFRSAAAHAMVQALAETAQRPVDAAWSAAA